MKMWSKQNLLLLLIIVYYLQGTVYEIPAVSQTIVFVIIYIFLFFHQETIQTDGGKHKD